MGLSLIGPGVMPIPAVGWGAVEILIWDYKQMLEKPDHEVIIVNTRDTREIIEIFSWETTIDKYIKLT
jgi:hypothetical protein